MLYGKLCNETETYQLQTEKRALLQEREINQSTIRDLENQLNPGGALGNPHRNELDNLHATISQWQHDYDSEVQKHQDTKERECWAMRKLRRCTCQDLGDAVNGKYRISDIRRFSTGVLDVWKKTRWRPSLSGACWVRRRDHFSTETGSRRGR